MVNVQRIKALAKNQGISLAFICSSFGLNRGYFNDVAYGKNSISEERLKKIADILHTTPEYLKDETDEPAIKENRTGNADTVLDPLTAELLELLSQIPEEQKRALLNDLKAKYGQNQ